MNIAKGGRLHPRRTSSRTHRHIQHFKKKRIDYAKYIDDFYLDSGLAYISCNVTCKSDIINRYSVEGYEDLNPAFASYIEENAHYIPVEYPIVLEVCGGNFSEENQKVILETIQDHFALKLGDSQLEMDANRITAWKLLAMGIISFLAVSLINVMTAVDGVLYEILLIPFWFFFWEFGDLLWFSREELINKKTEAARVASMKIVFKQRFRDDHDGKQAAEQIMEEIFSEEPRHPCPQ